MPELKTFFLPQVFAKTNHLTRWPEKPAKNVEIMTTSQSGDNLMASTVDLVAFKDANKEAYTAPVWAFNW